MYNHDIMLEKIKNYRALKFVCKELDFSLANIVNNENRTLVQYNTYNVICGHTTAWMLVGGKVNRKQVYV